MDGLDLIFSRIVWSCGVLGSVAGVREDCPGGYELSDGWPKRCGLTKPRLNIAAGLAENVYN